MAKLASVVVWLLGFSAARLFLGIDHDKSTRAAFDYGAPRLDLSVVNGYAAPGEVLEFDLEAMAESACQITQVVVNCPELGITGAEVLSLQPIDFGTIKPVGYGRDRQRIGVVVPGHARPVSDVPLGFHVRYKGARRSHEAPQA
jgi:hypothetical protein